MNEPKITVIVPIYKVEKYLVQCIDSILNQTLKDIEVILVDEGDLDACRYIIDHYEQTDSRVRTIHEKNGGYGASVNKGINIATGEYISIIESDDFIDPNMFKEVYDYAKSLDADVVKMPYFEYWDKTNYNDEKIQLCHWYAKTKNIPENCTFSIEEQPILVAIHPSIWSALYKTQYIKDKNIKCIEAKGAGYVDNHFRMQTLCQTNKIAWLKKPFNYYRLSNPEASATLYNIGTFIQRWADVHKLFEEKFPKKQESLSKYFIVEEWINTFCRLYRNEYFITKEQCDLLINNLSYIQKKDIEDSPVLKRREKTVLLQFKKYPERLKVYIDSNNIKNTSNYRTLYKLTFLGLDLLKIKAKNLYKWKIVLLGFIPFVLSKRKLL